MTPTLAGGAELIGLLRRAKLSPEDDAPRLVLADWLEDHGEGDRAEFVRLQLRLAPGAPGPAGALAAGAVERCEDLLRRRGAAWLGPLWQGWPPPLAWHRGLLALRLPRRARPGDLGEALPWVDTALFVLNGRPGLLRAAEALAALEVNHAQLDLRQPVQEGALLEALSRAPASPFLRTLSLGWPLAMLRHAGPAAGAPRVAPAVGESFFRRLLRDCPVGRGLTHLGSTAELSPAQAEAVRALGAEPAHARQRLWMHLLPPQALRARPAAGPGGA